MGAASILLVSNRPFFFGSTNTKLILTDTKRETSLFIPPIPYSPRNLPSKNSALETSISPLPPRPAARPSTSFVRSYPPCSSASSSSPSSSTAWPRPPSITSGLAGRSAGPPAASRSATASVLPSFPGPAPPHWSRPSIPICSLSSFASSASIARPPPL